MVEGPFIGAVTTYQLPPSVDDGAHWDQATVRSHRDGEFDVKVRYPKLGFTTGAVSLKAEAWDVAGNRVEQTLTRAHGLRDATENEEDEDVD